MEADEKRCPYCAETIKAAAIKCRYCGETLAVSEREVTGVTEFRWANVVTLQADGSPRAFLDAIVAAVQAVGLPVAERNYDNLTLRFESKGISWKGG